MVVRREKATQVVRVEKATLVAAAAAVASGTLTMEGEGEGIWCPGGCPPREQ